MKILISYDITNDKRRRKVAKIMEGYGYRVQYSVFECELTQKKLKQLQSKLRPHVKGREFDSIRFYPLIDGAADTVIVLGHDMSRTRGTITVT